MANKEQEKSKERSVSFGSMIGVFQNKERPNESPPPIEQLVQEYSSISDVTQLQQIISHLVKSISVKNATIL